MRRNLLCRQNADDSLLKELEIAKAFYQELPGEWEFDRAGRFLRSLVYNCVENAYKAIYDTTRQMMRTNGPQAVALYQTLTDYGIESPRDLPQISEAILNGYILSSPYVQTLLSIDGPFRNMRMSDAEAEDE